jgi:hypothetical protein
MTSHLLCKVWIPNLGSAALFLFAVAAGRFVSAVQGLEGRQSAEAEEILVVRMARRGHAQRTDISPSGHLAQAEAGQPGLTHLLAAAARAQGNAQRS